MLHPGWQSFSEANVAVDRDNIWRITSTEASECQLRVELPRIGQAGMWISVT